MNPGLVVKLRPTGPWRIGPDSGARNKVDAIYHSDTLYGAVTSAMARLGSLEEWLDATARSAASAVCFSSCFPFVEEIGFVTPPRTVWPPTSPGMLAARIRWKSARFVPLGIVGTILAGEKLDDAQWAIDGPSGCLLPSGRLGPFRMGLRGNAAVDRLNGSIEKHATACLEFRKGAGLWTVVSFADDAARERWSDPVKAAFRLLADSGFGGERSRGWGRSEAPEFVEGSLPEMMGAGGPLSRAPKKRREKPAKGAGGQGPEVGAGGQGPEAGAGGQGPGAGEEPTPVPPVEPPAEEPPVPPVEEPPVEQPAVEEPPVSEPPAEEPEPREEASQREKPDVAGFSMSPDEDTPEPEPSTSEPESEPVAAETAAEPPAPEPEAEQIAPEAAPEHPAPGPRPPAPERPPAPAGQAYWLLSLYTPSADDDVDWTRGSYSLVHRAGRVDTSGDLKKHISMVTEGSVVYASRPPRGSAPDVAPDGSPHPVFRAGFAVAIPIGEAS
jgi:CRISPR type III-A-associated RAMP protein Csm4